MNIDQFRAFVKEEADAAIRQTLATGTTESFEALPRNNLCDPVSNQIAFQLEEFGYTVLSPVRAPVDGAKHFVAIVVDTPDEASLETDILIDATIKQFSDDYPALVIQKVTTPLVESYYDSLDY